MFVIINNIVFIIHILSFMFFTLVIIGNFFKKKSFLEKYDMYGECAMIVSFGGLLIIGMQIALDHIYAWNDPHQIGPSLGTIVTGVVLAFAFFAFMVYYIAKWQKNIPES